MQNQLIQNKMANTHFYTKTGLSLTPYILLSLQVSSKILIKFYFKRWYSCLLGSWLQPPRIHVSCSSFSSRFAGSCPMNQLQLPCHPLSHPDSSPGCHALLGYLQCTYMLSIHTTKLYSDKIIYNNLKWKLNRLYYCKLHGWKGDMYMGLEAPRSKCINCIQVAQNMLHRQVLVHMMMNFVFHEQ
jgi:hypothetical protein